MHRAFKERDTNFWSHPSLHLRHGLFHLYFVQIIGNLPVSGKATSSVKPSSLFVWQLSTNECLREWMSESESEIEVAQSCQTLCDPVDCSPTGSTVHGILQARILEWVAISFSRGSSRPRDLPDPGIEPRSPTLQADALTSEPPGKSEGNAKLIYKSLTSS